MADAPDDVVPSTSPDLVYVRDVGRPEPSWSPEVLATLGYTAEALERLGPNAFDKLIPDADRVHFEAAFIAAQGLDDGQVIQVRHRVLHADGTYRWLSRRLTPHARDADGNVTQLLGISRDVSDTVALEGRLSEATEADRLAGLPNRRAVADRATPIPSQPVVGAAVVFCDVAGPRQTDEATARSMRTEVEARLLAATRETDTVGRLDPGKFVLILRAYAEEDPREVAEAVADRVRLALSTPVTSDGTSYDVAAQLRVAMPGGDVGADNLLRIAELAMSRATASGTRGHVLQL